MTNLIVNKLCSFFDEIRKIKVFWRFADAKGLANKICDCQKHALSKVTRFGLTNGFFYGTII